MTARVAILGGSGYGGGELLRLLLLHPRVEIGAVTSRGRTGPVHEAHPNLRGVTDLEFSAFDPARIAAEHDAVFLALPNGNAARLVPEILARREDALIIDLSGDFRLRDPAEHQRAYGEPRPAPNLAKTFVYGVPELFRAEIRGARRIAGPGCFATAVQLAMAPLARAKIGVERVLASCVTGSSGSGAAPKAKTHHPSRDGSFSAYRVLNHQHAPEIAQSWRMLGFDAPLHFVPHSGPFVRGIFACCMAVLPEGAAADAARIERAYRDFAEEEFFVRLAPGSPDVGVVARTNFADIAVTVDGDVAVAFCAIDNLGKGMAGAAVQNMNLALGFDECAGLTFPGTNP